MDVISTHIFQKYGSRSEGRVTQSAALLRHKMTQGQLRAKERLARDRRADKSVTEAALFSIKSEPWGLLAKPEPRPTVGASCLNCTPSNRKADGATAPEGARIINVLDVWSLDQTPKGMLASLLPDLHYCSSFAKYDYPYVYDSVMKDSRVREAVESAASDIASEMNISESSVYDKIVTKQIERAQSLLMKLRSTISDMVLRLCSWVFLKTLPMMFTSMSVDARQMEMIKRAHESGLPLIFLPLHRSHMDYIAVTLTLVLNNIKSPLVAAGDNLSIPFFGKILRGLGAFFIKRRMDPVTGKKDLVYRAVLQTYITHSLQAGHNFEFFIEGKRSRSGKPSMPKGGLLSIFVDAYQSQLLEDAWLIPVSINSERLVDDSFLKELTGAPKDPESFTSTVSAIWSGLTSQYGHIRIDFNEPFSLNELVRSLQNKYKINMSNRQGLHVAPSSASLYGTDVVVEEQRLLVDSIARHILYDCCQSTAVMCTNAVSLLLLYAHREGVYLSELTNSLDTLRAELRMTGKDMGFSGESVNVINHALELLGEETVIKEYRPDGLFVRPVLTVPDVLRLNYYSNVLLPHFALEAVVGLSVLVLAQNSSEGKIYHEELMDTSLELCKLLQFEFVFTKTCQCLNDALFETIDNMTMTDIISVHQKPTIRSRLDNANMDIDDDFYEDEDELGRIPCTIYKVNMKNKKLLVYARLIHCLIDTYSITAMCLPTIMNSPITEREFVKYLLSQVTTRLDNKVIHFGESISTETITNSIRLFEKLSVIHGYHNDGIKLLVLNDDYKTDEFIQPVIERVQRFQISDLLV